MEYVEKISISAENAKKNTIEKNEEKKLDIMFKIYQVIRERSRNGTYSVDFSIPENEKTIYEEIGDQLTKKGYIIKINENQANVSWE